MMGKFKINDKVDVLDGSGLFGRIVDKAYVALDGELVANYKVACPEIGSKWYNENELAPLELAPAAPAAPATADAGGTDRAAELAGVADHLATESVMLAMEIAEALGVDRHTFLDADGPDAIVEHIEGLRADYDLGVKQVAMLQSQLAATREALEAANGEKRLHDITYEHASKRRDEYERALAPFAKQWQEWQSFARMGGEMDIVEFFTDSLEPEVLARWLKNAAQAAPPGSEVEG